MTFGGVGGGVEVEVGVAGEREAASWRDGRNARTVVKAPQVFISMVRRKVERSIAWRVSREATFWSPRAGAATRPRMPAEWRTGVGLVGGRTVVTRWWERVYAGVLAALLGRPRLWLKLLRM